MMRQGGDKAPAVRVETAKATPWGRRGQDHMLNTFIVVLFKRRRSPKGRKLIQSGDAKAGHLDVIRPPCHLTSLCAAFLARFEEPVLELLVLVDTAWLAVVVALPGACTHRSCWLVGGGYHW
jgi:hypothetical protein